MALQFAQVAHELLCGLPSAARMGEDDEESSSSAFATALRGACLGFQYV